MYGNVVKPNDSSRFFALVSIGFYLQMLRMEQGDKARDLGGGFGPLDRRPEHASNGDFPGENDG